MTDMQALVAPVDGDDPAGPDLSYDPGRLQLSAAFETSASGESAEKVDWRRVLETIDAQSLHTRDISLPVYMMCAGVKACDLARVEQGAIYLAGLCENLWEEMHPSLEELGFEARRNACDSLTSIRDFLGPLRRLPLVSHARFGMFSGEDIERFARERETADGYGAFRAALDDLPEDQAAETAARLMTIRDAIARVDAVLIEKAGDAAAVNFTRTYEVIETLHRALSSFVGNGADEAVPVGEGDDTATPATPPAAPGPRNDLRIETREDVIRCLDAAIDYYHRREPASPVPVALERAKAWVGMDFLSIIQDIAPDSLHEAQRVLTSKRDENP